MRRRGFLLTIPALGASVKAMDASLLSELKKQYTACTRAGDPYNSVTFHGAKIVWDQYDPERESGEHQRSKHPR
jgi:hypothetical protein